MRFGSTVSQSSIWVSDSAVASLSSPGAGLFSSVSLFLSGSTTTVSSTLSYDVPTMTQIAPTTAGATTGSLFTLFGKGFGSQAGRSRIFVGFSECLQTDWTSDSTIVCRVPSIVIGIYPVAVRTDGLMTSRNFSLSVRQSPLVQALEVFYDPDSSVSITGRFFGSSDSSPRVRLATVPVDNYATWISDSSIISKFPPGAGVSQALVLNVDNAVGVVSNSFSYFSPIVTALSSLTFPVGIQSTLTVSGIFFGELQSSSRSLIVSNRQFPVLWKSDTLLEANISRLFGANVRPLLQVENTFAQLPSISFTAPTISSLVPQSVSFVSNAVITVFGSSFGNLDLSPVVSLSSMFMLSSWTSDSSITARISATLPIKYDVSISLGQRSISSVALEVFGDSCSQVQQSALNASSGVYLIKSSGSVVLASCDFQFISNVADSLGTQGQ